MNIFKKNDWYLIYRTTQDYEILYHNTEEKTKESTTYLVYYSKTRNICKIKRQGRTPTNLYGCSGYLRCLDKIIELGYTINT